MSTYYLDGKSSADIIPGLDVRSGIYIYVTYGNKRLSDGEHIDPSQGKHQPRIELVGADQTALYTLLMVDPDAPRPEDRKWSEYLHLMITNISEGKISTGNIVVDYVPPSPPEGVHRYVFALFRQQSNEPIDAYDPTNGRRRNFNSKNFTGEFALGQAQAGFYFTSSPSGKF